MWVPCMLNFETDICNECNLLNYCVLDKDDGHGREQYFLDCTRTSFAGELKMLQVVLGWRGIHIGNGEKEH